MEAKDINIAEILSVEKNQTCVDEIKDAIEKNPIVVKALEVAKTVEEVYDIMKKYVQIKFENFKVCFEKSMDFFRESKAELSDEVLDTVAGGGWLSNFWNKYKTAIIATAIFVGCVATGGLVGLAGGALVGAASVAAAAGAITGTIGGGMAVTTYLATNSNQ